MNRTPRLATILILAALAAAPSARAASSAVASASDSVSTSVESVSRSFKKSSDSSSRTVVGQGEYEVILVAEVGQGHHEVTLQALPGQPATGSFTLIMPDAAVAQGDLAVGRKVSARERPYGWEFARADTRTAFFLLLADDWFRELHSVPVTL